MPEKIHIDLGNVQKTLLLPLWGRAVESHKPRPLLVDRVAQEIIETLDFDFAPLAARLSPLTQMAWIMRSNCTDEVIRGFLAKYPAGTVVNLGCGLDTTFERVDNGRLRWVDLDLPDVIRLRRQLIRETPRRTFLASSFLEPVWLDQVEIDGNVLFIAAGVFYYFSEDRVRGFLLRLADRFPGCQALFDVSSPYGVRVANKMVIQRSGLDERSFLTWGLESPAALAAWDARLRILQELYYFGRRARSLPLRLRLIGRFSDCLKIQYMLHLQLGGYASRPALQHPYFPHFLG